MLEVVLVFVYEFGTYSGHASQAFAGIFVLKFQPARGLRSMSNCCQKAKPGGGSWSSREGLASTRTCSAALEAYSWD